MEIDILQNNDIIGFKVYLIPIYKIYHIIIVFILFKIKIWGEIFYKIQLIPIHIKYIIIFNINVFSNCIYYDSCHKIYYTYII